MLAVLCLFVERVPPQALGFALLLMLFASVLKPLARDRREDVSSNLLRHAGEGSVAGRVAEENFPIKLRPPLRRRASAAFRP